MTTGLTFRSSIWISFSWPNWVMVPKIPAQMIESSTVCILSQLDVGETFLTSYELTIQFLAKKSTTHVFPKNNFQSMFLCSGWFHAAWANIVEITPTDCASFPARLQIDQSSPRCKSSGILAATFDLLDHPGSLTILPDGASGWLLNQAN